MLLNEQRRLGSTRAREWDKDKNEHLKIEAISEGASIEAYQKCSRAKCNHHGWRAAVRSRPRGKGCPFCSGLREFPCTSLATLYSESLCEIDDIKNEEKGAVHIDFNWTSPESQKISYWFCGECHQSYTRCIRDHLERDVGWPNSSPCGSSRIALEWVKGIEQKENVSIQCATSTLDGEHIGEKRIAGRRVDKFVDPMRVYQYHGCYWHSCVSCHTD